MNSFSRKTLLISALATLVVVGGGCVLSQSQQQDQVVSLADSDAKPDTKQIGVGLGIRMDIPEAWRAYGEGSKGEVVYVYDCPASEDDYFCRDAVYVSAAETGQRALLDFSIKIRDFAWYCPKGMYGECSSDEAKLEQVEMKDGYWTVSSVGIAENAAVAFPIEGKYIVVFGRENARTLYEKYRPLVMEVVNTGEIKSPLARECTALLSPDRNIPLSAKYQYTGVMGALFTAFDCGDVRAQSVYDYLGLENLKEGLGVGIQYMPQRLEVYQALEKIDFVCEKSLNSQSAVLYEGWCEIGKGKSLSLESLKSFYDLEPDLSYSYFLLAADPTKKKIFVFGHTILKTDQVCSKQPVGTEIGGVEYPIASVYTSKLATLGELFTQYQCGNSPFNADGMVFGSGSHMELISAPSKELKEALQQAGFTCDNQYQSHTKCTDWTLIPVVPIEYLFPIEHYLEEIKGEGCFHCG